MCVASHAGLAGDGGGIYPRTRTRGALPSSGGSGSGTLSGAVSVNPAGAGSSTATANTKATPLPTDVTGVARPGAFVGLGNAAYAREIDRHADALMDDDLDHTSSGSED